MKTSKCFYSRKTCAAYMDFYKAVYPSLIQDWDGTVPDQYAMNLQVYEALQNKRLLFFLRLYPPVVFE